MRKTTRSTAGPLRSCRGLPHAWALCLCMSTQMFLTAWRCSSHALKFTVQLTEVVVTNLSRLCSHDQNPSSRGDPWCPLAVTPHSPPVPRPRPPVTCFLFLQSCLFWTLLVSGVIHYVALHVHLLSLSAVSLEFICVVVCISCLFLFFPESYSVVWVYHIFPVHSLVRSLGLSGTMPL